MSLEAVILPLKRLPYGAWFDPGDPGEPGYGDIRQRGSITARECEVLSALARGRHVLEIGTGLGVSTTAMAATAAHVTTLDPDPWVAESVVPRLMTLPNVSFYADRSLIPPDSRFDLVFVDGVHTADAVAVDAAFSAGMVQRPGLLLFHDAHMPTVAEGIVNSGVAELAFGLDTECGLVLVVIAKEA